LDADRKSFIIKTNIQIKKASLTNVDGKIRKRSLAPGQVTEVYWDVKNLHFKHWGDNVSLRCLNNSDL